MCSAYLNSSNAYTLTYAGLPVYYCLGWSYLEKLIDNIASNITVVYSGYKVFGNDGVILGWLAFDTAIISHCYDIAW